MKFLMCLSVYVNIVGCTFGIISFLFVIKFFNKTVQSYVDVFALNFLLSITYISIWFNIWYRSVILCLSIGHFVRGFLFYFKFIHRIPLCLVVILFIKVSRDYYPHFFKFN